MKIKKFKEMFDNYIQVGDFEKTIDFNSPTYGNYKMTKVATIDLIKACEDKNLSKVYDFYSNLRNELVTSKSVKIETKRFGDKHGQNLYKIEYYVPILEDNLDWEPPIGSHKSFKKGKLPVAIRLESVKDIIEKLIK